MRKLLVVLALAAAACGGGDSEDAAPDATSTTARAVTQTTLTVGDAWDRMWNDLGQDERDELCAALVIFGPENAGQKISDEADGRVSQAKATDLLQESCLDN